MTDKALRKALSQQSKQMSTRLPSNFAYNTLRRIERERQVSERREQVAATITIAACCILGVGSMIFFYGDALLKGLASMAQQQEAFSMIPGIIFCCLFFAVFNLFLRRRFSC